MLSAREARAIARAHRSGRHWLGHILLKQAQGRFVEARLRRQFPSLKWSRAGVDVRDPATGLRYEILSGTNFNMNLHAMRMPNVFFRMITF